MHHKVMPLAELLFAEPSPAPCKAALALRGMCTDDVRLPIVPVSGPLRDRLRAAMGAAGLL